MPAGDRFARGVEPLHLAEARARGPEMREVHNAGLVVVGEMARLPPVGRRLDDGECGVGQASDPPAGPLLRMGGTADRQRERGERDARDEG